MAKLYLPDGSAIEVPGKAVAEEVATPTLSGVRSPWGTSVASGLDPKRLAAVLRTAAESGGETADYLQLVEEMEEREPHYRSVLMTRKLAIRGLEPKVEAKAEDGPAVAIAEEIRAIVGTPRFRRMVVDLLDAIAKGYAVVEIVWDTAGPKWTPRDFLWRDPRWFQYDRVTGRELRLRVEGDPDGLPLQPGKFVVHEPRLKSGLPIRGGLGRTALWLFMLKSFTVQDWMTFLDVYGIPIRVGKWQPGASAEDRRTLLRAVSNLVADAAVTIPSSMVIDILEAKASGTDAHERAAAFWNAEVSKLVLGQTMTTDDGSSMAQAEVHDRIRLDIAEADADEVADAIQIGLVEPWCAFNHGLKPEDCPRLTIPVPKPKDMTAMMAVTKTFVDLGGKVSMAEVRDEIGWSDPGGDEVLGAAAPASATEPFSPAGRAGKGGPGREPDGGGIPADPALNAAGACWCGRCGGLALNRFTSDDGGDGGGADPLDVLAGEALDGWEAVMDPILAPVRAALEASRSFEEFRARLEDLARTPDLGPLSTRLATLTAIARGLGDIGD